MKRIRLYIFSGDVYSARHCGGVAERLKAAVLKTADGKPSESSNLSSSATSYRVQDNEGADGNAFARSRRKTVQQQLALPAYGGVAEWLKAAVLKTADGKPSESSNLSSSANISGPAQCAGFFVFCCWCNLLLFRKIPCCFSICCCPLRLAIYFAIVLSLFLQTSGDFLR